MLAFNYEVDDTHLELVCQLLERRIREFVPRILAEEASPEVQRLASESRSATARCAARCAGWIGENVIGDALGQLLWEEEQWEEWRFSQLKPRLHACIRASEFGHPEPQLREDRLQEEMLTLANALCVVLRQLQCPALLVAPELPQQQLLDRGHPASGAREVFLKSPPVPHGLAIEWLLRPAAQKAHSQTASVTSQQGSTHSHIDEALTLMSSTPNLEDRRDLGLVIAETFGET